MIQRLGIRSVAIPPLGSGLGGLVWADVRSRIAQSLESVPDVRVIVFEPNGAPVPESMVTSRSVPGMTPGRAALVGLMDRYIRGLLDPFLTLLELHKLMYFMQEAGESLKLKYTKGPYGPYAENLRHVLKAIEGHMVTGYADGGDDPSKQLELIPGTLSEASKYLSDHPETQQRFERVAELVDGFESPFGLELLSTVHWVLTHDCVQTLDDVVSQVHGWSERKHRFSRRQIAIAVSVLESEGWLEGQNIEATAAMT